MGEQTTNRGGLSEETYERAWDIVVRVRDASPRAGNDACSGDIVHALALAGLLRTRRDPNDEETG